MPEISDADLARLRQLKQWSNIFMVVHVPQTMFTGTIDDPDIAKGERHIIFDNGGASPGYTSVIFVEDTFTDANGTSLDAHTPNVDVIGGGWNEPQGNYDIQGNEANVSGLAGFGTVAVIDAGVADDIIVTVDATAAGAGAHTLSLVFRYQDISNFWMWEIFPNTGFAQLGYYLGGGWNSVWNVNIGIQLGRTYSLMVELQGQQIDCYIDGILRTSTNNAFLETETEHGIIASQLIGLRFDNFGIGQKGFGYHTTLWIGTTPGERDIGIIRIREIVGNWPYYSGLIKVAENADILWRDGLHLTVKDEHRIWPRFPRVDVDKSIEPVVITWWKDYDIEYIDQTYNEPPVPIMGPPACAFIDEATGLATVNFWGEDSYLPRGGDLTGTWTFPHGTPATANALGTEAIPHAVTWDTPGVYMTRLSIWDTNGRLSHGYRPVFILERDTVEWGGLYPAEDLFPAEDLYPMASPYFYSSTLAAQDFEIRSIRGNFSTGGWMASIRVFRQADVEDFPEGAMIVIFAEDWYAGEEISIGGYGHRENIVFVGWIKADSVRKEPLTGEITFLAHTVDGELRNCPAFPIGVERVTDTPDNWLEIQDMTLDLSGFYIGYWHSTLYEVSDVLESGDTRKVMYMDIPQSNIYNQLDKGNLAETIFARALSDRQSRFKYDVNPQYLVSSKRDDLDTIISLTDGDWLGRIDIEEIHERRVSWVDASGVRVAPWEKVYPVYSIAPGDVPAADGIFKQLTRLVLENQGDANRQAGFSFAHLNKMYPGRTEGVSRVRVPMIGNYRIFDIHPQEWVEFPSLDTVREGRGPGHETGTPWPTGTRFIPRNIDITFQNEFSSFMVTTDLEPETTGTLGESVTFPGQLGTGGSALIVQQLTGNPGGTGWDIDSPFISMDLFADSPTWAQRHNSLPTFGAAADFIITSIDLLPPYTGKDDTPIMALIGIQKSAKVHEGIYRNADLRTDTAWTAVLTDTIVLNLAYAGVGSITDWGVYDIEVDSTTPGWAIAFVWVDHSVEVDKVHAFQTINYGITWTHLADISLQLGGGTNDFIRPESAAIVDPYDSNYIYLKIRRGAADWYWARSTDKGVTWATRMGGAGNTTIELQPGQGSDDAYYDPAGSGWSLTFLSQMGEDISGNEFSFGVRFPNPGIPINTVINTAICKIKAFPTGQLGGAITVRIRGVEEVTIPTFTDDRAPWDGWGRTAASVNWNPGNWVPGTTYNTPDISAIIQELVNQVGWTPDSAIVLDFELTVSNPGRMRVAYNYENSTTETPILEINYDYAAVTDAPSRPVVINPAHDRESLGSFFRAINPATAMKTVDGWATRYTWFEGGAGVDGPVSRVVPLGAHGPIVYLTSVEGNDSNPGPQTFVSYLFTSINGEDWGAGVLLPCPIAQAFNVWPWIISGETLMYLSNRTGDSVNYVDHVPLQFWISELSGIVGSWVDKTGNLNDLIDALGRGRDRLKRIIPLET